MGRYDMIRQVINIKHYWKVIVYYNIDYDFFNTSPVERISQEVLDNLRYNKAKAVTISNIEKRESIVLINKHKTRSDYINSIVHEAEHVKQAILDYYNIEDIGENPAYLIGYLVSEMYKVYNKFLCSC